MKNTKKIWLVIIIIIFIMFVSLACAKKEEAPEKKEPGKKEEQKAEQAVYVGSDKCYSCHSDVKDMVTVNAHGQAFKPLENYNVSLNENITVYESVKEGEPKKFKLNEAKITGVMSDHYVIGKLEGKYYRLAAVKEENSQWVLKPATAKDLDNDGQEEWVYKDYTCASCHSPGLALDPERETELEPGFSCESCHGPGSIHITTKSKETIKSGENACLSCHTASEPKAEGDILIAQNHYGTRDWFDSNHNNGKPSDCLNCHTAHKTNVEGKMIKADTAQALCSECHGESMDPKEIMWINPTDEYNHFTKDHSFGKYPYESFGDNPETKPVEITNEETISKMKQKLSK